MSEKYVNQPMLDMFLFETSQLIGQLEQSILASEKSRCYTPIIDGMNIKVGSSCYTTSMYQ